MVLLAAKHVKESYDAKAAITHIHNIVCTYDTAI